MFVSKTCCRLFQENKFLTACSLLKLNHKPSNDFLQLYNANKLHTSRPVEAIVAYKLSDIGEGIRDVTVKEWYVKVGDKISQFDKMCEVQSDKASVTITSRYDGVITKIYHDVDGIALVGQPLVDIEVEDDPGTSANEDAKETTPVQIPEQKIEPQSKPDVTLCIPSVRRMAKEHNIDLSNIKGSGKDGRILKEDVVKYMQKDENKKQQTATKILQADTADRIEPIRGFQKAMVKSMTEALKIPHFVYSDELSVTKLSRLRKEIQQNAVNNTKLSFMPFFIKAVSNALQHYPVVNSSLSDDCENVIYKNRHNIGIAMHTTAGLAVPVIKNVQNLSVMQIAEELNRLMSTGKQGTFATEDLTDGTFSISNIGIVGGTYTHPVILPPQVGIIAIGKSKVLPRFDSNGAVVPEEVVCLSASADHRVVDGVTMANFVQKVKKQIEHPYLLFLNI